MFTNNESTVKGELGDYGEETIKVFELYTYQNEAYATRISVSCSCKQQFGVEMFHWENSINRKSVSPNAEVEKCAVSRQGVLGGVCGCVLPRVFTRKVRR